MDEQRARRTGKINIDFSEHSLKDNSPTPRNKKKSTLEGRLKKAKENIDNDEYYETSDCYKEEVKHQKNKKKTGKVEIDFKDVDTSSLKSRPDNDVTKPEGTGGM
ncbi:MAG: hypothetical protein R3Y64_06620 [Peptostreptococcaceae bacterium]